MEKKTKVLMILLLILFGLVLYLIFTSESIKQTAKSVPQPKQDNTIMLESNYKLKAKEFFVAYEGLIKDNGFNEQNISELKNNLLSLKVPLKFKELHIQFVLALTKMENYLAEKNDQEKSASIQAINQLKADYSWLND